VEVSTAKHTLKLQQQLYLSVSGQQLTVTVSDYLMNTVVTRNAVCSAVGNQELYPKSIHGLCAITDL